MKETEKLYESITGIEDQYIEEARTAEIRKPPSWRNWAAMAACFCVIAVSAFAVVTHWGGTDTPDQIPNDSVSSQTAGDSASGSVGTWTSSENENCEAGPDIENVIPLVFNELSASPEGDTYMFYLGAEQFKPMTFEETLDYFGVDLSLEELLPDYSLSRGGSYGQQYGLFQNSDGSLRYDINSFQYTAGEKSVTLTLRTIFQSVLPPADVVLNGPEELTFNQINGWDLVIFQYQDYAGAECVHTEFRVDNVIYTVTGKGVENSELYLILNSLLPEKTPADGPNTVTGTVTGVENSYEDYFDGTEHHYSESHNFLRLKSGDLSLSVWLPGKANQFTVGDPITVTWNGEPATVSSIWPGQLVSAEKPQG